MEAEHQPRMTWLPGSGENIGLRNFIILMLSLFVITKLAVIIREGLLDYWVRHQPMYMCFAIEILLISRKRQGYLTLAKLSAIMPHSVGCLEIFRMWGLIPSFLGAAPGVYPTTSLRSLTRLKLTIATCYHHLLLHSQRFVSIKTKLRKAPL